MKEKVKVLDKLLQFSLLLITYAYQVNYGMQFFFTSDPWHACDVVILIIYIVTATLRMLTWVSSSSVSGNRTLAITGYLYGLIALFLTERAFGHVMEVDRGMGAIQIAVFVILKDLRTIFWLFIATVLGFSLVITKIFMVETSYISSGNSHNDR